MIGDTPSSHLDRLRVDEAIYQPSGYKPKWLHLEILRRLQEIKGTNQDRLRVYDVGCASGSLLQTLSYSEPDEFELMGSDISEHLLDQARAAVPTATFTRYDLTDGPSPISNVDVVVCSGVLSIFDDIYAPIAELLRSIRASTGGTVILVLNVNEDDVDLLTRYRTVHDDAAGEWTSGWNCWSKTTLKLAVTEVRPDAEMSFDSWRMPTWLPRLYDDPMRTFSVLVDGEHRVATGSGLFPPQTITTINLPPLEN